MFPYYGRKSKLCRLYPPPAYDTIIEPFAGTAGYSLFGSNWKRNVILVEKYSVVVRIYKWLQGCSESDVLSLPKIEYGSSVDDYHFDCDEPKWMIGFIINRASSVPKKSATSLYSIDRPNSLRDTLQDIANNLHKIRHWTIINGDYQCLANLEATWFIDPPYEFGGEYYRYSNKKINYPELSKWCQSRNGQVIVCENTSATWMDFHPLTVLHGSKHSTLEAIWTNDTTTPMQVSMF